MRETAAHSRIHAWRLSWTEEPGGSQSVGSRRVGHESCRASGAGQGRAAGTWGSSGSAQTPSKVGGEVGVCWWSEVQVWGLRSRCDEV